MGASTSSSNVKDWLIALRPHTLPASIAPVSVGLALAYRNGVFDIATAISSLLVAMILQSAVNLANDYFDYLSGVDESNSPGFERACANGRIDPSSVKQAMIGFLIVSLLPGLHLVYHGGIPLLLAGMLSVGATVCYSGGPFPYASYGLGDLMVFLFFGLVATSGTYYVQFCASTENFFPFFLPENFPIIASLLIALPPGCLSTAIMVINNLRDLESDRKSGKYTLAVLIGRTGSRLEYVVLFVVSYAVPVYLYLDDFHLPVLLPLLTIPFAIFLIWSLLSNLSPEEMNHQLTRTAQFLLLQSLLFSTGIILS